MKIVIADYPDVLGRELEKEFAFLREDIPDAEIVVHPYQDAALFYQEMADADGLLTAFLPLDKAALDQMPRLRDRLQFCRSGRNPAARHCGLCYWRILHTGSSRSYHGADAVA